MMEQKVKGEISGAFVLGFIEALRTVQVLPPSFRVFHGYNLTELQPHEWYPQQLLYDLICQIDQKISKTPSFYFMAGVYFTKNWYEFGVGKQMISSALDWIRLHESGQGYTSAVRGGTPEEIGSSICLNLDEEKGIAIYEDITIFPPEFTRGVFYGGCLLFDDLDYFEVNVEVVKNNKYHPYLNYDLITLNFKVKPRIKIQKKVEDLLHTSNPFEHIHGDPEVFNSIVWRYKHLQIKHEIETVYRENLSNLLTHSLEESNLLSINLQQLTEVAEKANNAKTEFLSNMSHELRTPLYAVIGYTDVLLQQPILEEYKKYIHTIKSSSTNLLTIINEILDFSKVEAGKIDLESIPFDLTKEVEQLISTMQVLADAKNIQLRCTISELIHPYLIGDPHRLNQILLNLVGNAIKFTDEGEVRLSIVEIKNQGTHCAIKFSIKDSGIGIPMDKQKILFTQFQQVDNSMSRKYGGTGLGLAISKKLIDLLGGKLELISEDNEGAEFYFTLNFAITSNENIVIDSNETLVIEGLETKQLLLADDNEVNRMVTSDILKSYYKGIRIDTVNDGFEVLQALKEKQYDLILMDIQMPNLNGFDATRRIRTELKSNIPIIALSASILPSRLDECLDAGMDDFVMKPFEMNVLVSKMAHLLNAKVKIVPKVKASADATRSTLIDLQRIQNMSEDMENIKKTTLILYHEIPENITNLKNCIEKDDVNGTIVYSHKLLNLSFYLGVNEFTELVRTIEDGCRENGRIHSDLITRIQELWEIIQREMEEFLRGLN